MSATRHVLREEETESNIEEHLLRAHERLAGARPRARAYQSYGENLADSSRKQQFQQSVPAELPGGVLR
jgi:hypothetical protein